MNGETRHDAGGGRAGGRTTSTARGGALTGAVGGAFATLVMTAYRMPIAKSPPPPAWFWSKFVTGSDPRDNKGPALVLHFLYGTTAGVVFGALRPGRTVAGRTPETVGLALGMAYAMALSAFGEAVILRRLLDLDLEEDESLIFHAGHLVYGAALGAWVGSRG